MLIRRWPAVWLAVLAGVILIGGGAIGCSQSRTFTISTRPPGADVTVDKVKRGRAPVTVEITFLHENDIHRAYAEKQGYDDKTILITPDEKKNHLYIDLEAKKRDVAFRTNVPAIISIDGKKVTDQPTMFFEAKKMVMGIDPKTNKWQEHLVVASAPGFEPATRPVSWLDQQNTYDLFLKPLTKNIKITATPAGAQVYINDQFVGTSSGDKPLAVQNLQFQVLDNGQFESHQLRVTKPGYESRELPLPWDATTEYDVALAPNKKTIRLASDPPGATFKLNDQEVATDGNGNGSIELQFVPNDHGDLPTITGVATKTGDKDYLPTPFSIGWDDGRLSYTVKLIEVPTRDMPLLTAKWVRGEEGWEVTPEVVNTIATKEKGEGPNVPTPVMLARVPAKLPAGSCMDTFAVSPDGRQLLFTVLMGSSKTDFRSQTYRIKADGSPGIDIFSDGRSLDLTPTYTPGGESIFFSSNFPGRRMSIWKIASTGALPRSQITSDTNDIYPSVDSDPQPKLYYQSFIETRTEPRLFSLALNTSTRADLTRIGGGEPRISPRNDQVVSTSANEKTDKRDLFLVPSTGGNNAQKLSDTPDVDECNPVWNRDGSRIAYASDAGADNTGRRNYDIWILDVGDPKHPKRLTTNGSMDDLPVWDPSGRFIYFRSNRGGEWAIWKMQVNVK